MQNILEKWTMILEIFKGLSGEQIALISVFVSFVIYILSKRSELNLKKHESKKENYNKLIGILEDIFSKQKYSKGKEIKLTDEMRKSFFDLGSSLLFYGSKRIYREYIFYRELSSNEFYKISKYYDPEIQIYVLAKLFRTIRKEIGLNTFDNISDVESLAFFVNDIANNPITKIKSYKARHQIRMLKLEMFIIDQIKLVSLSKLYFALIAPIFSSVGLVFKYFVILPLGKIIIFLFPNFRNMVGNNEDSDEDKNA